MRSALLLFILGISLSSYAEYRAFLLEITEGQDKRLVKSSLDPEQYRGYYPVSENAQITYIDTWMCYGRTGGVHEICPSPTEIKNRQAQDLTSD